MCKKLQSQSPSEHDKINITTRRKQIMQFPGKKINKQKLQKQSSPPSNVFTEPHHFCVERKKVSWLKTQLLENKLAYLGQKQ